MLRFAFAALAGIAMTVRLEQSQAGTARQLALLKTALVALLEQAGSGEPSAAASKPSPPSSESGSP